MRYRIRQQPPSFQKIIIDKVKTSCPILKRSKDTYLEEYNIYLPTNIFRAIFDESGKESNDIFSVESQDNESGILWYRRQYALARGENRVIKKLMTVVEGLVLDNDIKNRVDDYRRFQEQLNHDERINELTNRVEYLHEFIHGGQVLGAIRACELCHPPNINP